MASHGKPHAVCIPFPSQGHINPMTKLAKLLHYKGFHITFVYTEYNYKRLLKAHGSVNQLPDFVFKTIPDGLPPPSNDDIDATQDIPALCLSTSKTCLGPFRDLISGLNNTSSIPPVSCIVSDGVMSFTLQVAQELRVPEVLFWTTSACGFMGYLQFPRLARDGIIPFKDITHATNAYLESTHVDWTQGVNKMRLKDLPSFIRTTDLNDPVFCFLRGEVERATKASAIILNTLDELEHDVLSSIQSALPPIYTIGSLHLLVKQVSDDEINSMGSNLWKEEPECLQWLDSKEPDSVVYVNFGSITVMTPQQMVELAWGLANSNRSFLWVIRPDLVSGKATILPLEFIIATKERGLLASWCPQEQVLNHPSICGFLTHSGWNSTLESICSGVPMICWPFFAEQQMNCQYSCVHWGVGMEIDSNVKREKIERLVKELSEGRKGKEMKGNAMRWKKKAEAAVAPGGSSYKNIDKLVRAILVTKKY